MQNILLVEDDVTLANGIRLALQNSSLQITLRHTLIESRNVFDHDSFDLLILDINLPDGSGLDLLNEVRKTSAVPIILLTANDMEMDIVTGLESGADDYITKPFSLAVLRARVNAQLRRSISAKPACTEIDDFQFDFDRMEFRKNGQLPQFISVTPDRESRRRNSPRYSSVSIVGWNTKTEKVWASDCILSGKLWKDRAVM